MLGPVLLWSGTSISWPEIVSFPILPGGS